MDVFLNGKFLPPDQARLPVDDAGFQHAVGLFETMAVYHGNVFRLDSHLARLADSAKQLGLTPKLNTDPLAEAVRNTIKHNKIDRARLRLTLTAGSLSLLKPTDQAPTPTLLIVPSEPTVYAPEYFDKGVMALVAPPAANPFDQLAGHKTLSYWARLRTLRQAASAGAGEAIWLSVSNHLASGAVSNIFLVKNDALLTPFARGEEAKGALPAPVLPGITRAAVLELAEEMNIPAHKQMLSVNDLLEADEVFLTNSSWHVLPVTQVEKKTVSDGKVGPVTQKLREALLAKIEEETID
ncbi:aminotransferase class IV [Phycisphaerales bacterium AB-hyl4]|uniref:branched-chain-amino-acid transaminase n=1 Tax=Natronomicrosphaera hydrolytica TaxID=3242702 RepID=A0ABV4U0F6_9BACT